LCVYVKICMFTVFVYTCIFVSTRGSYPGSRTTGNCRRCFPLGASNRPFLGYEKPARHIRQAKNTGLRHVPLAKTKKKSRLKPHSTLKGVCGSWMNASIDFALENNNWPVVFKDDKGETIDLVTESIVVVWIKYVSFMVCVMIHMYTNTLTVYTKFRTSTNILYTHTFARIHATCYVYTLTIEHHHHHHHTPYVSMLQHSPVQNNLQTGGCHTSDHMLRALFHTHPPRGAVVAAWWSVESINI